MRYYIIAGEASGDLHGSNLIRGLKAEDPEAQFRLWGGDLMLEAATSGAGAETAALDDRNIGVMAVCGPSLRPGAAASDDNRNKGVMAVCPEDEASDVLVRHYKAGAVMGVTDVLAKAGQLLGNVRFCKKDILEWKPDVVILIDYPGFNMKIARFCHGKGIKVFYYIAPKTWASRSGRNRKLKAWVDRMFIVFPFEVPYFTEAGIPFEYKGNPLVDAVDAHKYERPCEGKYVAMLAGSRKGEIARMMPVLMDTVRLMRAKPEYADFKFLIAGAPARSEDDYRPYIGEDVAPCVSVVFGRTYDVLKYAGAAVINSGTASLEAALIGTPQVVGWSSSAFTVFVARRIFRVLDHIKYISLGNLCVDRLVFKEFLQQYFNAPAVAEELTRLLSDETYRKEMLEGYDEIRQSLGGSGASRAVAKAMIKAL